MIYALAIIMMVMTGVSIYFLNVKKSLILLVCSFFIMMIAIVFSQNYSYEFWRGKLTEVYYKESYMENVITTDSKGNTKTTQVYHSPKYWVKDSNNNSIFIDEKHYIYLAKKWGKKNPPQEGFFHGNGTVHSVLATTDVYSTTEHIYKNNTQANDSIYKYNNVTPEEIYNFNLIKRPTILNFYYCPTVLNGTDDVELQKLNAEFGKTYQINILILIFRNQPIEAAILQEAYWKGGEKNELCLCFGLNNDNLIDWARAFSWSESEDLKADFKHTFSNSTYDEKRIVEWLKTNIPTKWKRKEFKDFNYISVDISIGMLLFCSLLNLMCCSIIGKIKT